LIFFSKSKGTFKQNLHSNLYNFQKLRFFNKNLLYTVTWGHFKFNNSKLGFWAHNFLIMAYFMLCNGTAFYDRLISFPSHLVQLWHRDNSTYTNHNTILGTGIFINHCLAFLKPLHSVYNHCTSQTMHPIMETPLSSLLPPWHFQVIVERILGKEHLWAKCDNHNILNP
jgi:hypothetical protein